MTHPKHPPNPRRAALMALSAELRPLVKMGVFESVNDALIAHYSRETGASDWRTFGAWLEAGRPVLKGQTGFAIWGKPRRTKADGAAMGDLAQLAALNGIEPQGPEFFPIAYLFHAGQVAELDEVTA